MEDKGKADFFQPLGHWGVPSLVSLSLHILALYFIIMLPPLKAPVKRVVQVESITLTAVTPKPAGGQAGGSGSLPALEPQTIAKPIPPSKPLLPATPKPKPKPVVKPPPPVAERPDPETMPRPAPPVVPPRPAPRVALPYPAVSSSTTSSNAGQTSAATGSGPGRGTGVGSGSGSGTGSGSGEGSGRGTGGSGSGSGAGSGAALQGYLAKVRSLLERNKIYPPQSRTRNEEGTAVVRFTIGSDGSIGGVSLARSSGHAGLDQAAQESVNRVRRFPPFPGDLQRPSLTVQVPLAYRLQGG